MSIQNLVQGESVKIQRSDGRVHFALISNINVDNKTVMVEWFERGETKGKEVDFKHILAMNDELQKSPPKSVTPKLAAQPVAHSSPPASPVSMPPPQQQSQIALRSSVRQSSRPSTAANASLLSAGGGSTSRPSSAGARPSTSGIPKKVAVPLTPKPQNIREVQDPSPPVVKKAIPIAAPAPSRISKAKAGGQARHSLGGAALASEQKKKAKEVAAAAGPNRRRSHCVKEVEKLKKNREERRARNAEQAQSRIEEVGQSNPNTDFLLMIRDYVSRLHITPLTMADEVAKKRITVCVRKRPLNRKETMEKEVDVLTVDAKDHLLVHEPKSKVDLTKYLENHSFRFDYSFDENSDNAMVYRFTAQPLVETIFDRGMATCFAYGQTGSGKTHTMGGTFTSSREQDASNGIYAMAAADVFRLLALPKNQAKDLVVCSSYFEIYGSKLFDLLNNKASLRVLEDGKQQVQVVGLREESVTCVEDVLRYIQLGNLNRTSGSTAANQNSSRSHAVFQLILRKRTQSKKIFGKFSLIDLAGNERGRDTQASDRQTRMEGGLINKSLLDLKECIRALGRKGAYLPFRASKLTLVLKDSFIGERSRTCMIAMLSPGQGSCEHTLNTLRYADRVKSLAADGGGGGSGGGSGGQAIPQSPVNGVADHHLPDEDDLEPEHLHQSLHEEPELEENDPESSRYLNAVSHLLASHDSLMDEHRHFHQCKFLEKSAELLRLADQPGYDNMEAYARGLEELLESQESLTAQLRAKVIGFRQQMQEEEMASQHLKRRPGQ